MSTNKENTPKSNYSLNIGSLFYICILIFISLWSVWPSVLHFTDSLPIGNEDIMITWIINHAVNKIPYDILNIFNGNIFYPYKNTIAYSEPFITSALMSYIPVKLSGSIYTAFNFSLIAGQISTSVLLFLWIKDITKNRTLSFVLAVIFVLSQIRMHYFVHIQLWNLEWFIASSWMIWKYAKSKRIIFIYLSGLFIVLQIYESLLPVFWIGLAGAVFLLPKFNELKRDIKHFIGVLILIIFVSAPVLFAYWYVHNEFHFQRTIRDAAHFSLSVDDIWGIYFSPALYSLFIFSLYFFLKLKSKKSYSIKEAKKFLIFSIFSLVMASGPVLKWGGKTLKFFKKIFIPLPYAAVYFLIPVFGAFRTPSRWMIPFGIGITLFSASILSEKKHKAVNIIMIFLLIMGISGKRFIAAIKMPETREYPRVYSWLKSQPGDAILEMPLYTSGDGEVYIREQYRMLYSLDHGKNLVNGASGFNPPQWGTLVNTLNSNFPSNTLELELKNMGVDFVLVHKDAYGEGKMQDFLIWGREKIVYKDEEVVVFTLIEKH